MRRSWSTSRWVRATGLVLLLALVAAVAIPFLVPADRFRPLLVQFVEGVSGRRVEIEALRLFLLPTVHLRVVNVRVKNPEGFPDGDLIIGKSVDVGLAPRALLSRRLVVTYITINGVRANLLRDLAGRTNYDFGPLAQGSAGASFLSLDRIGAVTVRNVAVAFSNYARGRRHATLLFTFSGLSARIQNIQLDASDWTKGFELTSDLRGVTFSTPALTKPVLIQKGLFTITRGSGQGTMTATLDGMQVDGTFTVARFDPLSSTFTAMVPQLDLVRLGTLMVNVSGGGPDAEAAPAEHRLLSRGDVKIGKILYAPLAAENMNGRLSVYTDTVKMDSYTLSFYGGTVQGAAAVDDLAAGLPARLTAKARGINVTEIMKSAASGERKITGTLDADLHMSTAFGRDPDAPLMGGGTFAVRNGTLERLDLKSHLAKMARVMQPNVPGGATRFNYFGGDVRIAQQRVYSDALRFEADGLEATASGSFGIDKTLDYAGTGTLRTSTSKAVGSRSVGRILSDVVRGAAVALGVRVPFSLGGTFDDPQFSMGRTPPLTPGQNPQRPLQQPVQRKQPLSQDLH